MMNFGQKKVNICTKNMNLPWKAIIFKLISFVLKFYNEFLPLNAINSLKTDQKNEKELKLKMERAIEINRTNNNLEIIKLSLLRVWNEVFLE